MSKNMTNETLVKTLRQIADLRDSGLTFPEIDQVLDLPEIGGSHSFAWRFWNDGRVKSARLALAI